MSWACVAPLAQVLAQAGNEAAWLGEAEQQRRASFGTPARQQQFVAGRWLVRRLLSRATGAEAVDMRLGVDAAGRCAPRPPWQASVSHSGTWVGALLAQAPVGLDIQQASPRRDWRALADFAGLQPCPDADHFYRHWTLAEAWLKAQPEPVSLGSLRGLRWQADAAGPGWQGREGELHWAVVAAAAPQWLDDLVPGALQPATGQGWAPLSAA